MFESFSQNENGYVKFSNGLLLQWGSGKTFPIPFVKKCFRVIATYGSTTGGDSNNDIAVTSISLTGYTVYRNSYNTFFLAIGV